MQDLYTTPMTVWEKKSILYIQTKLMKQYCSEPLNLLTDTLHLPTTDYPASTQTVSFLWYFPVALHLS